MKQDHSTVQQTEVIQIFFYTHAAIINSWKWFLCYLHFWHCSTFKPRFSTLWVAAPYKSLQNLQAFQMNYILVFSGQIGPKNIDIYIFIFLFIYSFILFSCIFICIFLCHCHDLSLEIKSKILLILLWMKKTCVCIIFCLCVHVVGSRNNSVHFAFCILWIQSSHYCTTLVIYTRPMEKCSWTIEESIRTALAE